MGNIISSFLDVFTNPNFYANVLAVTPPILLAALGCSIAQKSGLVQMGMEGIMLLSSFLGKSCSSRFRQYAKRGTCVNWPFHTALTILSVIIKTKGKDLGEGNRPHANLVMKL